MTGRQNYLSNLVVLLLHTTFISCVPVPESAECVLDEEKLVDLGFEYLRDATNNIYPDLKNEV